MRNIVSFILINLSVVASMAQGYRNPVIPGYHPQPQRVLCRW